MAAFNEQLLGNACPNFFELVANESMQEALRPTFQYICKVECNQGLYSAVNAHVLYS